MKKYNIELNQEELMKIIEALDINIDTLQDYIIEDICERDKLNKKEYEETKEEIKKIVELNVKLIKIIREE